MAKAAHIRKFASLSPVANNTMHVMTRFSVVKRLSGLAYSSGLHTYRVGIVDGQGF